MGFKRGTRPIIRSIDSEKIIAQGSKILTETAGDDRALGGAGRVGVLPYTHLSPLLAAQYEAEALRNKIRFLLAHFVETPKGYFTFPDGEVWECESAMDYIREVPREDPVNKARKTLEMCRDEILKLPAETFGIRRAGCTVWYIRDEIVASISATIKGLDYEKTGG